MHLLSVFPLHVEWHVLTLYTVHCTQGAVYCVYCKVNRVVYSVCSIVYSIPDWFKEAQSAQGSVAEWSVVHYRLTGILVSTDQNPHLEKCGLWPTFDLMWVTAHIFVNLWVTFLHFYTIFIPTMFSPVCFGGLGLVKVYLAIRS